MYARFRANLLFHAFLCAVTGVRTLRIGVPFIKQPGNQSRAIPNIKQYVSRAIPNPKQYVQAIGFKTRALWEFDSWRDAPAPDVYSEHSRLTCSSLDDPMECLLNLRITDSVDIKSWFGRVGNNMIQVTNAVFVAGILGKPTVRLPSAAGPISDIFALPASIAIEASPEAQNIVCSDETQGTTYFYVKCNVTESQRAQVLNKYVFPHLKQTAQIACAREASNTQRELVVHLRSGDLLDATHRQSAFAPCVFFQKVIADFAFERVRLVTEPDLRHPCLGPLTNTSNNYETIVQAKSVAEDGCAIAHARHLALGAVSTFNMQLSLMQIPHRVSYNPFGECSKRNTRTYDLRGEAYDYCIPGLDKIRTGSDKIKWMLSYPKEIVKCLSVSCP